MKKTLLPSLSVALALSLGAAGIAHAQNMPTPALTDKPVRLRGTIVRVDDSTITLKERGGEVVTLTRAPNMPAVEVYPIRMSAIKTGSFVGAASLAQPDGTQKAVEVLVFPEAARGSNEGSYPWDLLPESTMTNATVAGTASMHGGRKLTLQYKGGEKTVIVPPNVPIVTFRAGKADALLVPGARALITAQVKDGKPMALRVNVGRDGFTPPM
ncbi:MAG: hypothetical protein V4505_07815 [Pseudomonadota bacterium]